MTLVRAPVPVVVMQHVEDAAHLRHVRSVLVRAPHVRLLQLGRIDERIAAHLDGIAVAGAYGAGLTQQALERPGAGAVFAATVGAIADRDADRLDKLLAITEAVPASRAGLLSAFGWVSAPELQGITRELLEAPHPWRREVGLAACAMHGVDPGLALDGALRAGSADAGEGDGDGDGSTALRARALRVAGQCGRRDLVEACLGALVDANERCRLAAASSALLLGNRAEAPDLLANMASDALIAPALRLSALRVVLKVVSPQQAQSLLAVVAEEPAFVRTLIQGIGIAGDPHYMPWLIAQMDVLRLARLAGEAFSFITGIDLAYLDLERKPPEDAEFGPNDDPADGDVALDEDESLPWPDPLKIGGWWKANAHRFVPGTRYFMGEPPSPSHCLGVLRTGFQRQRIAAAEYLSLLRPGMPLFNVAVPTWRQHRLFAQMSA